MHQLNLDPTPEQQKDLACADAHEALRAALFAPLLKRPDAAAIFERVEAGDELRLELATLTGACCAVLIGAERQRINDGYITGSPGALELFQTLAAALTASLNAEPEARRVELAALMPGHPVICYLRINAHSEVFGVRVGGQKAVFSVARAIEVNRTVPAH